mgnify:CR=1 FL=1
MTAARGRTGQAFEDVVRDRTEADFVEREWDDELEGKLKRAWDFLSGKRTEDHRG